MSDQGAERNVEQDRSVVYAFTATPAAIERFRRALIYADFAVNDRAEQLEDRDGTSRRVEDAREHGEWLRWGLGRIAMTHAPADLRTPERSQGDENVQ